MLLLVMLVLVLVAVAVLPFRNSSEGIDEFCKVECTEQQAKGPNNFFD
jgi:hypothetical protein